MSGPHVLSEQTLRALLGEGAFRAVLDALVEGAIVVDARGEPIFWNAAAERMLGPSVGRSEQVAWASRPGIFFEDGVTPMPAESRPITRALRGEIVQDELMLVRRSERDLLFGAGAQALRAADGRVLGAVTIFREVSEQRRTERELRATVGLYRALAAHLPDTTLFLVDASLRFVVAEGAALERVGMRREDVEGHSIDEVLIGRRVSMRTNYEEALRGVTSRVESEASGRAFTTDFVPVRDPRGAVVAALAVARDVTEARGAQRAREQLLAHLAFAERFASLGTLASGMAHEMNNPVAIVLTSITLAKHLLASSSDATGAQGVTEVLVETERAATRIADIVRRLRALSPGARGATTPVDVNEAAKEASALAGRHLERRPIVSLALSEVARVRANRAHLTEALSALVVNAMQAMAATAPEASVVRVATRMELGQVVIEVEDRGCGIAPDVKPRIFDPYFTTRDVGQGLGLGLSMVHAVVTAMGGTVEVDSALGRGSTFRLRLPALPA